MKLLSTSEGGVHDEHALCNPRYMGTSRGQGTTVDGVEVNEHNAPETAQGKEIGREAGLWSVLNEAALHGPAGEIVNTIDLHTEADPVAVLLNILPAFGNCINSTAHARVQHDNHPAGLFVVRVGDTSKGRKGTGWSTPRYLFSRCDENWSRDRVKSGLSSGEGLIYNRGLLQEQWREHQERYPQCPLVFHSHGRKIANYYKRWHRACQEAGLVGKIPHDFRRTAVRNMVRAGIPERVAMQISGHKTRNIFDRYHIVSDGDLREAAKRLEGAFPVQTTTLSTTPPQGVDRQASVSH